MNVTPTLAELVELGKSYVEAIVGHNPAYLDRPNDTMHCEVVNSAADDTADSDLATASLPQLVKEYPGWGIEPTDGAWSDWYRDPDGRDDHPQGYCRFHLNEWLWSPLSRYFESLVEAKRELDKRASRTTAA